MWTVILVVSAIYYIYISGVTPITYTPVYMGCFSPDHANSHNYKTKQLLTWDECYQVCDIRLTIFAGSQGINNSSSSVICFCLNEFGLLGKAMEYSTCQSCQNKTERLCGTEQSIALYKIRETTPFAMYLATANGVKLFREDTAFTIDLVNTTEPVQSVDYDYTTDQILFTSASIVFSSYYNPSENRYVEPKAIVTAPVHATDLVVDWVLKMLYMRYKGNDRIYETDISGNNHVQIYRGSHVDNLAVDPYKRLLFYIENGTLQSYNLENKTIKSYDRTQFNMKFKLALDISKETILSVAIGGERNLSIVGTKYDGTMVEVLYNGPDLTNPVGLDVFGDEIFWGNHKDNKYTVYKCKLRPKCSPYSVKTLYQTTEEIRDIKVYHLAVQSYTSKYLCSRFGCSHSYVVMNKEDLHSEMMISSNNKTWEEPIVPVLSISSDNEKTTSTSTLEYTSTAKSQTTDTVNLKEELKAKETAVQRNSKTMKDYDENENSSSSSLPDLKEKKNVSSEKERQHSSKYNIVTVIAGFFGGFLIITVFCVIFASKLTQRFQRHQENIQLVGNSNPELVELQATDLL